MHLFDTYSNKEYDKVEDVPSFDGYTFIRFSYPGWDTYYQRYYVSESIKSQFRGLKVARNLFVLLDEEVLELSKWSKKIASFGNKKYPTDSLRLYFVNKFDKCIYMDGDVYLTKDFVWSEKDYPFVWDGCTGTILYNPKKDNDRINDFFNFYENELCQKLDEGDTYDQHCDVVAYNEYLEWCVKNKKSSLATMRTPEGVCHFSILWPSYRDKKRIVLYMGKEEPSITPRYTFSHEMFWVLMDYFLTFNKECGIIPEFSYNYGVTDDIIFMRSK